MFVKRLLQKAAVDLRVPDGNLTALQLCPRVSSHHGIPGTASVLAYEPVQRLLAVSTSDGQTKILGAVGVEELLQSPTHFPCKYLEFLNNRGFLVHVNTQNDIEVWDVEKRELVYFQKWEADITSFSVLQGSPFMFVGDSSGTVSVLQYKAEDQQLSTMPYVIPAHVTLGGLVRIGSPDAPSVIGVLPQPDVFFNRLLIAYSNGLIILWRLHETQVHAVRGGSEDQRLQLANYAASLKGRAVSTLPTHQDTDDEEEEKEICSLCWACPTGSVLATGYTDGEILLWKLPTIIKGYGQTETQFVDELVYSGEPMHRIDLAPGKAKMPVVGLVWGASAKSRKGVGGRLYLFGGTEVGHPEVLTVLSLDGLSDDESGEQLVQWELALQGSFADMSLLPAPGGSLSTPAAALVLLMMPGLIHVYDERSIANYFVTPAEGMPSPSLPQPVPLRLPVTETKVTSAKLVLVSSDGMAAKVLLQLPREKNLVPSTLPAGTKWPISGGALPASSSAQNGEEHFCITGHEDGSVKIWDVSSHSCSLVCTVGKESKVPPSDNSAVTVIEFCDLTGLLAVGHESGLVFVYKLHEEACEVNFCTIGPNLPRPEEEVLDCEPGFGCIFIENAHRAAIGTISIAISPSRLAVGDESGMVSILDSQARHIIFFDRCFPHHPGPIISVSFSSEPLSKDNTPTVQSPRSSPPTSKHKPPQKSPGHVAVLYVVGKDATMVALDGSTGVVFGSGPTQPKNSSTAVSLHLLEASGTPVSPLNIQVDEILETGSPKDPDDLSSKATSSSHDEVQNHTLQKEVTSASPDFGANPEALFLLLCCVDSLRLYSTSAVLQGLNSTLRKVKLDKLCCWSSFFSIEGRKGSGLVIMFITGELEFRSLPDLGLLKEASLSSLLNWKIEPNTYPQRTVTSSISGHLVTIDPDGELAHIFFLEEKDSRDQVPLSRLYDKDLAKAADAAITYSRSVSKKKAAMQGMQSLIGGALKELKNALDIEQPQVLHVASELPKLFNSRPFTVVRMEPNNSGYPDASGSSVSSKSNTLDIDDIDVEDTALSADISPAAAFPHAAKGNKFTDRLSGAMKSLKGKERSDEAESNRMQLFDGKNESKPSKQQTSDDIRAKYGHPRKSQETKEISSVLDMTRDKLNERGEKLRDIGDKTAEMEDNAENFASMAEELAKRMAQRKWWEF